jgi:hypothetical protein
VWVYARICAPWACWAGKCYYPGAEGALAWGWCNEWRAVAGGSMITVAREICVRRKGQDSALLLACEKSASSFVFSVPLFDCR